MENFLKTLRTAVKQWYLPLIVGILLVILGFYVLATPLTSYLGRGGRYADLDVVLGAQLQVTLQARRGIPS